MQFRILAVERGSASDRLHDLGLHRSSEIVGGVLRFDVGVFGELDFHQLFRPKRLIERLTHRVRDPLMSDVNGHGEVMSLRAQLSAPFGRQCHRSTDVVDEGRSSG